MPDDPNVPNPSSAASDAADAATLAALAAAQAAITQARDVQNAPPKPAAAQPAPAPAGPAPEAYALPSFDARMTAPLPAGLDLLSDVNLNVKIELGRTKMLLEDVLRLGEGTVVELDKLAGDPVDIYVNERPVARGEVLVLNDNFCVRISEILSKDAIDKAIPKT